MTDSITLQHGTTGNLTGRVTDIDAHGPDESVVAIQMESVAGISGWILFTPTAAGRDYDWERGTRYRLHGVIGCDAARAQRGRQDRVTDALTALDGLNKVIGDGTDLAACPTCGGPVDVEDALDISAEIRRRVAELTGPIHGIGDESLSIDRLGTDVIDWRPQPDHHRRRSGQYDPPAVVCPDCGTDVTTHYREEITATRADTEGGMQDIVKEALDAPEQAMASQASMNASPASSPAGGAADVGMATGGAKDANNFRDNIHEGYVPHPDSLAYEGLFYDYYFETGDRAGGDSLFYPSYSMAVSESPLTGDVERYLTVGLNSNLTEDDLERKPLNLVAVVDVSGSMDSQFDQYYYDEHGNRCEVTADGDTQSKMAAAREALSALTEQLRDEDRFGVVLYSNDAHIAKPLRRVGETNMDAIRDHITDISAGGGTDMSAGYAAAMDLLKPHYGADLTAVENRIVFMTDAMPNLGTTGRENIVAEFDTAADKGVHTTFVGIGLDTNADLVESISEVRGANHYFVHSTEQFTQRLADEFTYMVTPLVFDLSLDVVSDGYEIEAVYGSPNADRATGEVMHVTTLFPSPTTEGETRGGVTLLQLRESDPEASLELVANWVERDGTHGRDAVTLSFPTTVPEHFDTTGIRKAVLLTRYGRLLREWMAAVRDDTSDPDGTGVDEWSHPDDRELGAWEEQSVPLTVPSPFQNRFEVLRQYCTSELDVIGDQDLTQELEILKLLLDADAVAKAQDSETTETNTHPDTCPSCGEDISGYEPGPHLCPHCGIEIS